MLRRQWVMTAAFAALLFMASTACSDEAEAVKTIAKAGGKLTVDDTNPDKPTVTVIMWGPGFKVELLKDLKELKSLQKLRIGGPWITDDGVKDLKELKNLQVLEIRSPKVTDAALKDLQESLPKLKIRRASPGETPFAEPK